MALPPDRDDSVEVQVVDAEDLDDPPPPRATSPRPASVPTTETPHRKRSCPIVQEEQQMYQKRGSNKAKGNALMAEAVNVLKQVCKQPEVPPVQPPDHEELFASYVASRIRAMDSDTKKRCEAAILKVLLEF